MATIDLYSLMSIINLLLSITANYRMLNLLNCLSKLSNITSYIELKMLTVFNFANVTNFI